MRDINDRLYDINDKKWPTIEVLILSPIAIMHVDIIMFNNDNVYFLVWYRSFSHCNFLKSHNLSTNPHVCKDRSIIGQKGMGRGKAVKTLLSPSS